MEHGKDQPNEGGLVIGEGLEDQEMRLILHVTYLPNHILINVCIFKAQMSHD